MRQKKLSMTEFRNIIISRVYRKIKNLIMSKWMIKKTKGLFPRRWSILTGVEWMIKKTRDCFDLEEFVFDRIWMNDQETRDRLTQMNLCLIGFEWMINKQGIVSTQMNLCVNTPSIWTNLIWISYHSHWLVKIRNSELNCLS